MQPLRDQETVARRIPEARYGYYRRCQEFRRNGEQCKAPAEKGERICHAHAGQRAMAMRREAERRAVLELAVAEMMRRKGRRCDVAELLMDFNGIQVTIATIARALIDGTISCKTAGRLLWDLQNMAKLLRLYQRAETTKDTKEHKGLGLSGESGQAKITATKRAGSLKVVRSVAEGDARITKPAVVEFPGNQWSNGPPQWARAA